MASRSADLISSEKTPLVSNSDGGGKGAIPKNHGSIDQPTPLPPVAPIPTVIIVTSPTGTEINLGSKSQLVTCPYCQSHIRTEVKYKADVETHWIAIVLLILCWPCLCLPYCCNTCKSAHHYCPVCKQYLGKFK